MESSSRNSRSHHGLSEDDYFHTPKVLYQEKVMHQDAPNLNDKNSDKLFKHIKNPLMFDPPLEKTRSKHLEPESCSDERTTSSNFTILDPNEMDFLRM